ncbi:MAG: hypothetical protein ACTSRZ_14695 [Promethearchaeota archaeon]
MKNGVIKRAIKIKRILMTVGAKTIIKSSINLSPGMYFEIPY